MRTLTNLTTHQKAVALEALSEISLCLDSESQWYVSQDVENAHGGVLTSVTGRGDSPEDAIEDHWKQVTRPDKGRIVLDAYKSTRRYAEWNGYMWRVEPAKEP